MTVSRWPSPAKLNLFLHVLGQRPDGYHRLQTVFQFLDYGDEVTLTLRDDDAITRSRGAAGVLAEADLTVRAAKLLQQHAGARRGVDIAVDKRVPMGAGLGGGSSNAATVLVALNRLWQTDLDTNSLAQLGLQLGADVPVFVKGHAAWAEGVGEELSPVTLPEPVYAVVVPAISVPTAAVFSAAELRRDHPPISFEQFLAEGGQNDCTPVTTARYPAVGEALRWLARHGDARMSGTGSAVFAAFGREPEATAALQGLPADWVGFVARGLNRSPLLDRAGLP